MCRDTQHGGRRCSESASARQRRNERKRDRYAVQRIATVIRQQDEKWQGDYDVDLTSPMVARAMLLAIKAHEGVVRKTGEAYINHPLRVAKFLQERLFNDDVVAVALLHDAVEDSDLTLEDLRKHGFNERVVSGVDAVTKREGEEYTEAVKRAVKHPIGRLVKLSDNIDNTSPSQLAPFNEERRLRAVRKYTPARQELLRSIREIEDRSLFSGEKAFTATYALTKDGTSTSVKFTMVSEQVA